VGEGGSEVVVNILGRGRVSIQVNSSYPGAALLGLAFINVLRVAIFELERLRASSACFLDNFCSGFADLCLTS
jgi:hypothetical protein